MINLDPSERPTFDTLLHTSRGTVFPESFYSFLHNYVSSINELSSENLAVNNPLTSASSLSQSPIQPSLSGTVRTSASGPLNTSGVGNEGKGDTLPSDSDHRIERIWEDYESIEPYIVPEADPSLDADPRPEFMASVSAPVRPFQVSLLTLPIRFGIN